MKYAFPGQRNGEVRVQFKQTENNKYKLVIADNGVGIPEDMEIDTSGSLGMNLMRGLTNQLDGTFFIENKKGLMIIVIFSQSSIDKNHQ
ncbi:sensor histidine kinase [Chryseobacterium shandongense]|uniref:Sensor histidine kinase n=1 Tax=Chryseobacterium shandongense TaxID=1493872 RepID=A0AAD1DNZ9_9FLAO|nr:sensor histidine kinase [Chryseobacterium shandongense]AZA88850.1 sensor histidine kinase [Chryseobacterium shandongense]AZA97394.1 sensor histidine kinase [Chryseobacterium shandongense]